MARPAPGKRRWVLPALAAAGALVLLANGGMRSLVSSWWAMRGLSRELAEAKREQAALTDRIAAAKGDDRALERAARAELGFQRPGEIEYRFPKPVKR